MGQFCISVDARTIAMRVLEERDGESFNLLRDALTLEKTSLICLLNEKDMKAKGKAIWAQARKVSGREAFAWGWFTETETPVVFVIEINAKVWAWLKPDQREALIAHELLHFVVSCDVDEKGKEDWTFGIVGHDLEEFCAVVEWYGVDWRPDLKWFAETLEASRTGQTSLVDLVDAETGEIVDSVAPAVADAVFGSPHLRNLARGVDGVESVTFSHLDAAGKVVSSATINRPS